MGILFDIVVVVFILACLILSLMWIAFYIIKTVKKLKVWSFHQAVMLKHRPHLWWQFHKKYKSCADAGLELDPFAMVDMTEEEFKIYHQKLNDLREKVQQSRCSDSYKQRSGRMVTPEEPRYDEVYKEGVEWLNKQ